MAQTLGTPPRPALTSSKTPLVVHRHMR
jgi:hypothetical protein